MALFGILGAAATLFGASKSASASKSAANTQLQATRETNELNREIYDQTRADLDPYLTSGSNALSAYGYELGLGDKPEGYGGIKLSPSSQYLMQMGREQIEAGAASRGGLYSGATLQALEGYRQNVALSDRDNQLNRLADLVGNGQSAAAQQGAFGERFATNYGNTAMAGANASAAGTIGAANAVNQGVNNLVGLYSYNNQLNGKNSGNPFARFA